MPIYTVVLCLHVITAILGLGQLAAATVLTTAGSSLPVVSLQRLMRWVMWSLLVMLVTGGALAGLVRGAFEHAWWLRLSVILFFVLGFLHSRVRRALRKAEPVLDAGALRPINRILCAMCVCVAAITYLMQAKPW